MLEYSESERFEGQGGEGRIHRPDEVFVKPLRFLHLEAYPFDRLKLFMRQVYNKSDTQVI